MFISSQFIYFRKFYILLITCNSCELYFIYYIYIHNNIFSLIEAKRYISLYKTRLELYINFTLIFFSMKTLFHNPAKNFSVNVITLVDSHLLGEKSHLNERDLYRALLKNMS